MRRINIANPSFEYDPDDPPGFRSGMARFGPELGAKQMGTSLYELPPGEALCPYHYEHAEEEWLLVLSGRPTLRDPDGATELEPFDLVLFPTGPDGAHGLRNRTDQPVRVLMYSTVFHPAVSVYPDSDKIGIWTEGKVDNLIVERSSGVEYFHVEAAG